MAKQTKLPIENTAIRFAPGRNNEPLTAHWKVWAQGSEVYATTRTFLGSMHVSVHEFGQVHYRLAAKQKQEFAAFMPLHGSAWFHALEIRFLWSAGAFSPVRHRESLKSRMSYLLDTPEGFVLYANLIIGATGTPLDSSLPVNLIGQTLWRTRLRDGRIAVLIARLLPLDDLNRERIRYFRQELGVHVTFATMPKTKYFELHDMHRSPEGGNVILVIPMGEEAFRSEQEVRNADQLNAEPRRFLFRSPRSAVDLIAPDGYRAAVIEAAPEFVEEIELTKGIWKLVEVGSLIMQIEPENLMAGSPIIALAPRRLVCIPNVGGGSPRSWEYTIRSRFRWLPTYCSNPGSIDCTAEQEPRPTRKGLG